MAAPVPPVSGPFRLHQVLLRLVGGQVLCGIGVAMMIRAELGLGPWDVLHEGLSFATGISVGLANILVGIVVLLLWFPLRQRPGLGTITNVIAIGSTIDIALALSGTPGSLALRWVLLVAGPILFGIGVALYIGAGVGTGPRDGVMTGLAQLGMPIALSRTVIELSALAIGWLLGGTVGLGTIYFALIVGPVIHVTMPLLRAPWFPPGSHPRVLGGTPG